MQLVVLKSLSQMASSIISKYVSNCW